MQNEQIVEQILKGNRRAIARAITWIENGWPEGEEVMDKLYPHTGNAYIVGITGPPGAGKSTLTDKLTAQLRKEGRTVGVLAIDPTSPFTGGALLGDRIRMQQHCQDDGVFIRSMATRDSLGGLAPTTYKVVKVLDAAGFNAIIIETVGVGQAEIDIINVAYTTLLLLVPGLGDDIQSFKAGIMEIADVFVINKADKPGKDKLISDLKMLLELSSDGQKNWVPSVVETVATRSVGIEELILAIRTHYQFLEQNDLFRIKESKNSEREVVKLLSHALTYDYLQEVKNRGIYDTLMEKVTTRQISPYQAVKKIRAHFEATLSHN